MTYRCSCVAVPSRKNIDARCQNVDNGAVIGSFPQTIVLVCSTHGTYTRLRSRGHAASTYVFVASSRNNEDASVEEILGHIIDGLGKGTSNRHIDDCSIRTVPRLAVICNKFHSFQDTGNASETEVTYCLDRVEPDFLGNTVGCSTNWSCISLWRQLPRTEVRCSRFCKLTGAGNVSSVSELVRIGVVCEVL